MTEKLTREMVERMRNDLRVDAELLKDDESLRDLHALCDAALLGLAAAEPQSRQEADAWDAVKRDLDNAAIKRAAQTESPAQVHGVCRADDPNEEATHDPAGSAESRKDFVPAAVVSKREGLPASSRRARSDEGEIDVVQD